MNDQPAPFRVRPTWQGQRLMIGRLQFGETMKPMPMPKASALALGVNNLNQDKWIGLRGDVATGYYNTEAEARAAVEAAVCEALHGDMS